VAGIPIPIRSEYPKETVEILKSINTVLGNSEKYEKVGMEAQTELQKNLSSTRKKYIETNVEIQKLLQTNNISNDLAREMQEKNRNELVKGFKSVSEIQLVEGQKNAIDTQLAIGYLTESQKESLEAQKKSLEIQEQGRARDEEILKLAQRGFISKKQEKYLKLKNKATTYLNKFLVKKKWLQNVGKSLKTMAQNAGSWIMQLLKFIFVMALFPGLMTTIINIVTNVVTSIINFITPWIPIIAKRMIKIITETLPNALKTAIGKIFPAIGRMLKAWADELKENSPFFGWAVEKVSELFGKDGMLTNFFKGLAGLTPFFIGAGIFIKLIMKAMPVFTVLNGILGKMGGLLFKLTTKLFPEFTKGLKSMRGAFGKFLKEKVFDNFVKGISSLRKKLVEKWADAGGIKGIGKTGKKGLQKAASGVSSFLNLIVDKLKIWGKRLIAFLIPFLVAIKGFIVGTLAPIIIPLLPIIAVVGAIIGALVLLWKYADKVYEFLDNVPKFLEEKLGMVGKILGMAFQVITAPLKFIVWLFKTIKKQGFKKTVGIIWKKIKEFGAFIWEKLKGIGSYFKRLFFSIFAPVISVFKKVTAFFSDLFAPMIKTMSPIFQKIGEILDWIWKGVISGITSVLTSIKKTISDIFSWFGGVGTFGAWDWMKKSQGDKDEYTALATRLQEKDVNMGDLKAWGAADEAKRQEMFDSGRMTKKEIATFEGMKSKSKLSTDDFEDIMDELLKKDKTTSVVVQKKTIKSWTKSRKNG